MTSDGGAATTTAATRGWFAKCPTVPARIARAVAAGWPSRMSRRSRLPWVTGQVAKFPSSPANQFSAAYLARF